jgi:hypothetical protein
MDSVGVKTEMGGSEEAVRVEMEAEVLFHMFREHF